jgi:hypothetical protein
MAEPTPAYRPQPLAEFLNELSELSYKYGFGISGGGELFELEKEDYERAYHLSDSAQLIFE